MNQSEKRRAVVAGLLTGTVAADSHDAVRAGMRAEARVAWAKARIDDLRRAYQATCAAWNRLLAAHPDGDDVDDIAGPPEQAIEETIWAEVAAAWLDRWPRTVHWGGL